jgi:hypothetical protein
MLEFSVASGTTGFVFDVEVSLINPEALTDPDDDCINVFLKVLNDTGDVALPPILIPVLDTVEDICLY